MIHGVIFDMDGLMFDTERASMRVWGRQLAEHGWTFTEEIGNRIRGRNDAGIRQVLESVYGPDFEYEPVRNGVRTGLIELLDTEGMPVKEGLYDLLAWLNENHIPRAIASSSRRVSVEHHCKAAGVLEDFPLLVCGDMVTHSKPDPEIFLKAAELMGVEPAQCLVLEDSFNGVRAGAAGGFVTVMVPDMDQPTPEIDALYTAKAQSLDEVLDWLKAGRL